MSPMRKLLLASAAWTALAAAAFANPLGPQVVGGSATVQGQGTSTVTVTQSTERAIINWNSFNIGAGELTRFIQPGSSSVTLNRVTGGLGPSAIDGTLTANGRIFLVNPDGVMFGSNAVINTAGFLATTSDIKNSDFMAGQYRFGIPGRPDASVVNQGIITATNGGFAALVAPGVRNAGTITANLGSVSLSSGNTFTLDFYGDKLITLAPGDSIAAQVKDVATGLPLGALVKNEGRLKADGGKVELTSVAARQVVDAVINNTGVIEANTIGTRNGMIVLGAATAATKPEGAPTQRVKVSGSLSAAGKNAGTKGGTVQITGESIELAGASVSVAGDTGGGTALIGGDVGGGRGNALVAAKLPQAALQAWSVPTAGSVTVDATTRIDASATTSGNGGKVVVWADGTTQFAGTISARGGADGGNGGFAEVSGHKLLSFTGTVDLRAVKGLPGTLLLDPADYYITDIEGIAPPGASVITNVALQNQLALGDVVIMTDNAASPAGQNGDIFVNASISWGSGNDLRLVAYRNIVIGDGVTISATSPSYLLLAAGLSVVGTTPTPTGVGTVVFNGTGKVDFSQSGGGFIDIAYNPTGGYANPTDFSANVIPYVHGECQQCFSFAPQMWVTNVTDLQNISQNLAGTYVLGNIDASATANWNNGAGFVPIGSIDAPFTGRIYGAGDLYGDAPVRISNLTINSSASHVGLFGVVGVENNYYNTLTFVENINLTNASITATSANATVGGIAGLNRGLIFSSSVSGVINASQAAGVLVGGLVGDNAGSIMSSHASASVSGGANAAAGGLVGRSNSVIGDSYASGPVQGGGFSSVGGLVGHNLGFINNAYALGTVTGTGPGASAGGLVGINEGYVSQTYATGLVTVMGQNALAGGLIGANNGFVSSSYWDTQTTGRASAAGSGDADGMTGLTSAQARSTASYNAFDFESTWYMVDGVTRPFLTSEWSQVITNAHQLQLVRMDPSANYLLANTIDLGPALANASEMWGGPGFAPLSTGQDPFTGFFAGQGHSILNLTMHSTSSYTGLFGYIGSDGTVSGLNLVNANVNGRERDGSGWVGTLAGLNAGTIELSSATGQATSGTSYDIGGLVGRNDGTISRSFANVTTIGGNNSAIGGLAGASSGTIFQSYAIGPVQAGPGSAAGGLVGIAGGGTITQSYATGLVTAPDASTGGLVAWAGATITDSYWDTQTTGQGTSGGGSPLTTQQFQASLPPGFDPQVWLIDPGQTYPFLPVGGVPSPLPYEPGTTPPPPLPPSTFQVTLLPTNFTAPNPPAPPNNDPLFNSQDPPPQGSGAGGGAGGNQGGGSGNNPNVRNGPPPGNGIGRTQNEQRFSGVPPLNENRFVPNEVIIQIANEVSPEQVQELARELGVTIIGSQGIGTGGRTAFRLLLPAGIDLRDIIRRLEQKNIVASAGPNYVFTFAQSPAPSTEIETTSSVTTTPDLPPTRALGQYIIGKLKLDTVHRRVRGENILVAVIDSAVDRRHPDLAGAVVEQFSPGRNDNAAPHAHGTGMTGAIASQRQLVGTAPGVKILSVDAFSGNQGTTFQIIKGLEHAIERKARIVNMSFAGPRDLMLERTLKTAYDKGMVLIAAAGNAGPKSPPLYPAADPHVIAVTATDAEDKVFTNANRGRHVAVAAPGVDILALAPDGGYQLTTGTSVATAHVSGIAALLLARRPTLTPDDVRYILTSSAKVLGRGRNDNTGYGLVDPERALEAVERPANGRSVGLETRQR